MLRRTKADRATKLPDKIELNIGVKLSPLQLKLYRDLLQAKAIMSNDGKSTLNIKNNVLM